MCYDVNFDKEMHYITESLPLKMVAECISQTSVILSVVCPATGP
jgi:hypothetical protein